MGFLITQTMTPFLKTINALAITFYCHLSYMYTNPEKNTLNINSLIAEIRKIKRIEKEIALTD